MSKPHLAIPGRRFYLVVLAVLFFSSCGYALDHKVRNNLTDEVKSVIIPYVTNSSTEPFLSSLLTNELKLQFLTSKYLRIEDREDQADAVLKVGVTSYKIEGVTVTDEDRSSSRRITLLVDASFKRRDTGKVIWQAGKLRSRQTYIVDSDERVTAINKEEAMAAAARELAEKIHNALFEGF